MDAHENSAPPQSNDQAGEDMTGEDVYHDFDRLSRTAWIARALSWLSLVFMALMAINFAVPILQNIGEVGFDMTLPLLQNLALIILVGGFLFVALQAIAEVIWVLLDIEDNTRRVAARLENRQE